MNKVNNKKRIVCFFPLAKTYRGMGGAERRIPYIFSQLDSSKYDVTIIFQVVDGQKDKIMRDLKKYLNGTVNIIFIKGNLNVIKYLLEQKFDWVCYTDCIIRSTGAIIGAVLGGSLRLMMNVTTSYSRLMFRNIVQKNLFKLNVLMSTQLDCLYPSSINILKKAFPKKNILLTPCSLANMEEYKPSERKLNSIVFAGRLVPGKGADLFVDAISIIQDNIRNSGYSCKLCGDGKLKDVLKDKIHNYRIEDIIDFVGHTEISPILAEAKVFCSLQSINNYPSQSLLEAISCGCYCIATNDGDTALIIKDSFGETVEGNAKDIADSLLKAIGFERNKWTDIKNNAETFAKNEFSVDNALIHFSHIFSNGN